MDKEMILEKIDGALKSFRVQIEKNDGSTLLTIFNTAKMGFNSVKGMVASSLGTERGKQAVQAFEVCMDSLEEAVKSGDKKLSAKALDSMDDIVKNLRDKQE